MHTCALSLRKNNKKIYINYISCKINQSMHKCAYRECEVEQDALFDAISDFGLFVNFDKLIFLSSIDNRKGFNILCNLNKVPHVKHFYKSAKVATC